MIQKICCSYKISNQKSLNPSFKRKISSVMSDDFFSSNQLKLDAINSAKKKIVDCIKNNGNEYSVVISQQGDILYEAEGSQDMCNVDSRCIEIGSVLMHGHPIPLPLSSGDLAVLFATPAVSEEAITGDGKFSKMSKTKMFVSQKNYSELYHMFEKQLCLMALDKLGIRYKLTKQDLIDMFKDYLKVSSIFIGENVDNGFLCKFMKDFEIDVEDIEKAKITLDSLFSIYIGRNSKKYDKEHNVIMQNYDVIKDYLNSPDGTKLRHEFLVKIAKDYNLNYETNLFD